MSDNAINSVLSQIRAMSAQAQGKPADAATAATGRPDFAGLLADSVNKVNELQQASGKLATAFEAGDPDVSLVEVMVARQKSSLAFTAVTQVRNKLLSAYQDIMNMPV